MKKKIYGAAVIMIMAGMLAGCGDGTKPKEDNRQSTAEVSNADEEASREEQSKQDAQSVADAILEGVDFKDSLAAVDASMALTRLYNLDAEEIEDSAFYTNSNATAEEIAVIKTKSGEYTDTVKAAYETRVAEQKAACEDYLPDEMPKLDAAVIYTSGNYVVLCISDDGGKAERVISDLLK